jgi:hypothetical protein
MYSVKTFPSSTSPPARHHLAPPGLSLGAAASHLPQTAGGGCRLGALARLQEVNAMRVQPKADATLDCSSVTKSAGFAERFSYATECFSGLPPVEARLVWTLAAIFVVEDNGHAESTASSYSVGSAQVGRGEGLALPSSEMDGSDFFAVYEVAGTQSRGSARAAARQPHPSARAALLRPPAERKL